MKFNLLRIALVSFLAFLAVVFSACDVGLGEAVDTEKPTISIEYPPKNVVIKEDFVISGKCHDETSMKSVTLAFQNSESEHVEKFTATLAQDKNSWSARINEYDSEKGKYLLPDGTYFVTAVATDSSGRQQEDKMTLRIDNTPPMIVLTNPGTVENEENPLEKAGGFGATIKIQGSVSDFSVTDNDSGSKLVFTVFDEKDKFLAYRELSNIPPSLGIIIGEYTDGTENLTDSNQFYKKIYGAAGSVVDTKYRKFKITVSDSARTYKGSAVNNERGNISECYYLKDEIYTDVNNKFSIGNSDLYEIIKKQAGKTGELTDHEKTILSSLEKFKHDSDDEYEGSGADDSSRAAETSGTKALKIKPVGTFFLNPKNNPSYEITSFDAFDFNSEKKWEERKISTSGNITLLAKSGLSEAPLEADSFKVVLFKTDENGIRIPDTEAEKNEDKEIPCEWTKNGSNYTGRVTLSSKYVEVAQCYGIELKGHDKAGLEFYNGSKAYRFSVQTGSTPPDVKITKYSSTNSGSTVYIKKNNSGTAVDLVIYGTAESRSGSKKGHVTLWPVVNGDKTQYANRDNKFTTKSNSEKDWSITVPGAYFNNKESDTYTVALYASDEISNETYKEITVIFDKENPKVQINSVDNVVVFDSETTIAVGGGGTLKAEPNVGYVNDVITVSGNVSDNDAFDKGSWKAMCGETEIAGGVLSSSQIKITIDTKTDKNGNAVDFEGKNLELKFTVFDRAGNKTDYEYKYPDENGKPLVISQLTDYPRVNLSNAELTVTTEDGIAVGKNLFDQTGNNRISGSIIDDDGIDTVEIYYSESGKDDFKLLYNGKSDAKGKTSYSINQELKSSDGKPLAEGFYNIKIIATDKKTDSENTNVKKTEIQPFVVCINNGAPTITFINPIKYSDAYQSAKSFSVTGKVTGEFGDDKPIHRGNVEISISEDGTWSDTISKDSEGNYSAGITKDESTGVYTITYSVKDRFGRETVDSVTFKIDEEAPKTEISQVSPLVIDSELKKVNKNYKNGAVNGIIAVQGSASDNDKIVSTVLKIYKVKDDSSENISAAETLIQSLSFDGTTEKTGEAIFIPAGITNTANNFKFSVNTEKLETNFDDKGIVLRLESKDSSGNIGYFDYPVFVCQETDIPTLKFNNGDVACTDENAITVGKNLFGMGSKILYINVTDDDGVKVVEYSVDGKISKLLETLPEKTSTTFSTGIDISEFKNGVHSLKFTVIDKNGRTQKFPEKDDSYIKVAYDDDVPVIQNVKIASKTYESNMFVPRNYEISGITSDSTGISKIELYINSTKTEVSTVFDEISKTYTWKSSAVIGQEGDNKSTIKAEDKFGRSSQTELSFIVDTTAPTWQINSGSDESPKLRDVDTTVSGGAKKKNHSELNDFGKTYWFNQTAITLSGNAYDKNGISGYTLKVNSSEPDEISGGSAYSITSAKYKEGSNTVTLTAKDKAGNITERTVAFYIDTEKPVVTDAQFKDNSGQIVTNSDSVELTITANDATSGLKEILIGTEPSFKDARQTISLLTPTPEYSPVTEYNNQSITIDIKDWADGDYTLYIRAVDVAGLDSVEKILTGLIIDREAPKVSYTSHSEGSTVNKNIVLEGTVSDVKLADSAIPYLYYRKSSSDSAPAENWSTAPIAGTFNLTEKTWKISDVDTTKLYNKSDSSCYYDFQVCFTDVAGNTTLPEKGSILKLKIDQDSDRPKIKVSFTKTGNSFRLGEKSFSGSVEDDDGVIQEIAIKKVLLEGTKDIEEWVTLATNSNEWQCQSIDDGTYDLYFKIKDRAGTEFVTAASDILSVPKLYNGTYEEKDRVSGDNINLSVDTNPPVFKDSPAQVNLKKNISDTDNFVDIKNNDIFGGKNFRYATFKVNVEDTVSKGDRLTVNINIGDKVYSAKYKNNYYETDENIDLKDFKSGIYQCVVSATDEAGKAVSMTRIITVDNTAPNSIKNVTPDKDTEVTGEFEMSGLIQDDEAANSGIPVSEAMWYFIPTEDESTITDETTLASLNWTKENLTQTSVTWRIDFSDLAGVNRLNYDKTTGLLDRKYMYTQDDLNSDLYNIPVWFKVVDNAGNIGYIKGNALRFNPNADKPQVQITYPEMIAGEELVMGGTVRFQGSASDNEGIEAVYLQFDFNDDGEYENGEGKESNTEAPRNAEGKVYIGGDYTNTLTTIPVKNEKGFKAKGTLSWSSSVDLSKFNTTDDKKIKRIRVRAVAVDNDKTGADTQLASAYSKEIIIKIDNNIPQLEDLKLVEYNNSDYETVVKEISYSEDMFISGKYWRLEGRAVHAEGVYSVSVAGNNTIKTEDYIDGDSQKINKKFFIPVNVSNEKWTVSITAISSVDSPYSTNKTCSVQIDNTAPVLESDANGLVIYKNLYGISENKLGSSINIQNSDGSFATITSRVSEAGSGFERVVFYFTRTNGGKRSVFNVMEDGGTGKTNRTIINNSYNDGDVCINEENLAVLKKTVTRAELNTLSFNGLSSNKNIRKAGLVKIGGAYHEISEIRDDSLTFEGDCSLSFVEAEFVYGLIVDNAGESRVNGTLRNDDGDGMLESYSKSGSNYTWEAAIPSANIPDGPVEIHAVVFDKAGNSDYKMVSTRISNSPVRITSVKLATDLNSNGTFEESEYHQFYAFKNADGTGRTDQGIEIWNLDTKNELYGKNSSSGKYWAVRDGLSVVPEFVGGTAPFYWTFTKDVDGGNLTKAASLTASDSIKIENKQEFVLDNSKLGSTTGEGKNVTYQFSFWDSTEELTVGSDTSWTVLNAHVHQELTDTIAPTITIKPFYWNSGSDNSLYKNSKDEGHIELESDFDFAGSTFTQSSGLYDKDPKVSGIIKIQGAANDNKILKDILVNIPGFPVSGTTYMDESSYITLATYSINTSSWNDSKTESDINAKLTSSGWAFTIDEESITQEGGHTIKWTLTLDTSRINGVAAVDVKVKVKATDQGNNNSVVDTSQTAEGKETSLYRMDVVPYITGLRTTLSGIEKKNSSVYGRTALGKYPVYYYTKNASGVAESEVVGLNGFNLTNGASVHLEGSITSLNENFDFELPENAKSGKFYVTVNEIKNLNNENYTDSKGGYTDDKELSLYENYKNYYNRQANGVNNDYLTDDLELAIWGINSQSAVSPEGVITEPTMHINPVDGQLGFSFSSGNYGYYPYGVDSKGNAQKKSLEFWCRDYTPVNTMRFIYDNQGHMFGVHAGTDTNKPRVARFRLVSSVWGPSSTLAGGDTDWLCAYSANNALRLEYMANYKSSDKSYVMNGTRFQFHPQLAASASGNTTNLYLMYYDSLTNELRFRAGKVNNNEGFKLDTKANGHDAYSTQNRNSSFDDFYDDAYTDSRTESKVITNYNHVSVLASSATNTGSSPYAPGERYDIAVVPGSPDVVVAVWNDDIRNTLWYSYLEDPIQNNHTNVDNNHVNKNWSKPVAILDGVSGGYAAIAVDSEKHVHIASYSKQNTGSLVYTYLESYDSPKNDDSYVKNHSVFVDSYGATGQYITIDFAKDSTGTRYVPYIGYLMTSLQYPKYAYLVDIESADKNPVAWTPKKGSDSDNMYTGAWESVILPTKNKFLLDDICIGVLRDSDGKLKNIPVVTGTDKCGGNGTSNPVLGYGINYAGSGYIETAQLK